MPKNIMNWLTLKIFFYLLIFYLIADVINSLNERSPENSASIINRITLIAEIDPNTIYQIEQEARQERIERFEEQQQLLNERRQQRNEQRQQEWNDRQQQWRDKHREQQQEYREMRSQQQEKDREMRSQQQERIRQRNERIHLRRENFK